MGIVPQPTGMSTAQILPDNSGGDSTTNPRLVVKKTTAPKNPTIKNPQAIKIEMREKDGREFGLKEANKLIAKFAENLSISPTEVPQLGGGMQKILDYIKKQDPSASSAAVKPAIDILKKLMTQGNQNPLASIPGIFGNLQGLLQQVLSQMAKENKKKNEEPEKHICPEGTIWDEEKKLCVIDPNQQESTFLTS